MKVFAEPIIKNLAIDRIVNAIKKYSPKRIEFVTNEELADLSIVYVYGLRRSTWWRTQRLVQKGKRYAIIQLVLRTTPNPNTSDWLKIWYEAEIVWSYYDLFTLCKEDKNNHDFNFFYAPLGVEADVFKETPAERIYAMSCSQEYKFSKESQKEIEEAAKRVGKSVFHLNNGMTDEELAKNYSKCEYVSGLRRVEGFELPVLEGLLCGARPIVFEKHHYRQWYGSLADYIDENDVNSVTTKLEEKFKEEPRRVSSIEKDYVKRNFNWDTIVKGFWNKTL